MSHERTELAVERILDAAGDVFARQGVQSTTMSQVAGAAGCSRATLYNHFADRRALETAFVHRETLRLSAQVVEVTREIEDPAERAVQAFDFILEAVRSSRSLVAWFSPPDLGVATAITADSEVLDAVSSAFMGRLVDGVCDEEIRRRGRWLVRMIVSLLAMPEDGPDEERVLVEKLVVPALLAGPDTPVPGGPRGHEVGPAHSLGPWR